ncbi:MAG: S-adenosylmethionine:tRNA ribosyltransferase-isomerase [Bacteroidales bacterium]|nr:S-adenosylmethionine:tRNA ribosyltransferase-isomerase [Bacteroidales bacterium]
MIPDLRIEDYDYNLPESRIAKYPLADRDGSKLLVYRDGTCTGDAFKNLPGLLPEDSLMVFNNTRVVPARMFFRRETGARIELFCLQPVLPAEYASAFASTGSCRWECVIGNAKRWKEGEPLMYDTEDCALSATELTARLIVREAQTGTVEFSWKGRASFSEILDMCGKVPIPPYLNRETESVDIERYQTTYALMRGSVAAPTAGLHFTENTLEAIRRRGIDVENICLHVGAGTFLPVKSSRVAEHPMHREPFTIKRTLLEKLASGKRPVTAVGTTSVRTLESLYYAGAVCIEEGHPRDVEQWDPYTREWTYGTQEALEALLAYLDRSGLDELSLGTRIIIVPGFRFRIADALVTNFHQPKSTLLLLVSAFVKGDWRSIYEYALSNGCRFLSYGDSSLLFKR